jgi:anaerobic selenocysteine-containing dehydrogenase
MQDIKTYGKTVIKNGEIQTLCRMCDMRCGLNIHVAGGKIAKIAGYEKHPLARGQMCIKGRATLDFVFHPDRLLKPLKKRSDGSFAEISYEQALNEIAEKVNKIKNNYGARAMGVWTGEGTGFFQQEEYARRFMHALGSPNYLSAESICFAVRHLAYSLVQGFYEPYPDFEHTNLILSWGANPVVTHMPYMRFINNGRKRGAKLIVIDPRYSHIAKKADMFVQLRPGTDGALAWGLANYLIQSGRYSREFVEEYAVGFEQFAAYAKEFTPEFVEEQTGVPKDTVIQIARLIIQNMPNVGNYSGVALEHQLNGFNTFRTIACLAGLCGAVDIKGGELWSERLDKRTLTLHDDMPRLDQKPIGMDKYPIFCQLRNQGHSLTAIDYMLGNGEYPLKGLIVSASNPVLTNPNAKKVVEGFEALELLVFRDLFVTESAKRAHYILPAASFLERSELHYHTYLQRVTLTTKVLHIPDVQDEFTFWRDLSHRLGFGEQYFPWKNEEAVNRWILEPSGITLEDLKAHPEGIEYKPRRYTKYTEQPFPTPTGKYEFSSSYLRKIGFPEISEYKAPAYIDHPDREYPFVLITGARVPQFVHSRFHNIKSFQKTRPKAEVEIHPQDAERLGIKDQDGVRVISETGYIDVDASVMRENELPPGVLQIPHGWNDANVNFLTDDCQVDPISGYPNLKVVPVRIEVMNAGLT